MTGSFEGELGGGSSSLDERDARVGQGSKMSEEGELEEEGRVRVESGDDGFTSW